MTPERQAEHDAHMVALVHDRLDAVFLSFQLKCLCAEREVEGQVWLDVCEWTGGLVMAIQAVTMAEFAACGCYTAAAREQVFKELQRFRERLMCWHNPWRWPGLPHLLPAHVGP
jgi:hypothetical protein